MSKKIKSNTVRIIREFWEKGNLDVLDKFYHPKVKRFNPPFKGATNLETYKEYVKGVRNAYSKMKVTIHEIIATENRTVVRYQLQAMHTGRTPTRPIEPSGKKITLEGCLVCHWKNGKVIQEFGYMDIVTALERLDMIPPINLKKD